MTQNNEGTKVPPLAQLESQIHETRERNLTGSLEHCKEELRDAYMNFKDLQQRCIIDMKERGSKLDASLDEHTVYYFKPETFLLDDPEKQRVYRDTLLKKVANVPKPEPITYLGDELHRSMCQSVADRSTPKATKKMLTQYYQRRQYALQHMKYKLLSRWAHQTLTSETLEMISPEATFMYGKLEFNLEQTISRHERLSQNDYYDLAKPENRPSTKAEMNQGSLYVENFDIPAQSLIREDDIEVYTRGTSYRNKINKVVNKFMSRLKWLALNSKYKVFEKAIEEHFSLKNSNIKRQNALHDRIKSHSYKNQLMTADLELQLNEALGNMHCKKYEKTFLSENDQILHGWKANHDEVPRLVGDNQLLKIKILETAQKFNLTGDIELDQGYSFSYQVTVFFPTYFMKQVIQSQFSVYDGFAGKEASQDQDPNESQKRTLNSMTYIDSNIFRDVSTTKNQCPTDEAIQSEFQNIKIMRLKSSEHWVAYVALTPSESDWHTKQQAILNSENPIDTLLRSAFDFLDVNDLATVNRINEDNSHQHKQTISKLMRKNAHKQDKKIVVQTNDGDKPMIVDQLPYKHSSSQAGNIEAHLLKATQKSPYESREDDSDSGQDRNEKASFVLGHSIYSMPSHLVVAYYTLRFMTSRDCKTKVMYTLNYFRAIQKRLALDLREFATRDRIDGQASNPFIQSEEANQVVLSQVNLSSMSYEKPVKQNNLPTETPRQDKKMTVNDHEAIGKLKDMATLRQYKANGLFNNRVFRTCPSFPKFHASHGEPLVHQSTDEEMDRSGIGQSISENAVKLMGRVDFVEINEPQREVFIKDDFGIYIIYDCVLQDMQSLEDELCKVGSYFLHKSEVLVDPKKRPLPYRDRQEIVYDLLSRELDFQFHKVMLVQVYMECYEHITCPMEQQKLMQIITDIMSKRPRINLQASYFVDAYDAEITCLQKQFELVKMLVDLQISLEKTENSRLQESLNLSYTLANQYAKNKWKYQDHEALLQAIEQTRQQKKEAEIFAAKMNKEREEQEAVKEQKQSEQLNADQEPAEQKTQKSSEKPLDDHLSSDSDPNQLDESDYFKDDENQFTQLLGLPQISIESIYQGYREKDLNVLLLMKEHSNFIAVYEGYPEFLTMLTHKSILDKNRLFKCNKWSQETGALDFYDTLDFINRFYAITQMIQQELYDSLKMWDPTLMTQIDTQVAQMAIEDFRKVVQFQDGTLKEYAGREFVEDESIVGNSDKLIFYAKECIGDLSIKPKHTLDPFLVAKLDVQSIQYFKWPKIDKSLNKYTQRRNGVAGVDYIMLCDKQAVTGIAKEKINAEEEAQIGGKVADLLNRRSLQVPSLMQTYCNMTELLRLRQEIILSATECNMLKEVYKQQCDTIGFRDTRVELGEGINFTTSDQHSSESEVEYVNFWEHGPSHMDSIELSIREFDPQLLSNFNFRNPDSFKINILTSGLEEVRAILQYQILQKHLMIVATRANALIIDSYQRAQSEINILQSIKVAVPNPIIDYSQVISSGNLPVSPNAIKHLRQAYKQSAGSACQPCFINALQRKSFARSTIAKEFTSYQTQVQQAMPDYPECVNRVTRCFRVKLLNKFVQTILTEVYLDAQKIQALQSCQRLRVHNRYFRYDAKQLGLSGQPIQVLKYETSSLLENFPFHYLPEELKQVEDSFGSKKTEDFKVINTGDYQILDYEGVPSSATLLGMEAAPIQDTRIFKEKRQVIRAKHWSIEESEDLKEQSPEIIEPETHLKRLLPTFTPDDNQDLLSSKRPQDEIDALIAQKIGKSAGTLLDYEEALYFGDSTYAQTTRYYVSLERIFILEWFIKQLSFKADDVIQFQNAIESGCNFFKNDPFDTRNQQELGKIEKRLDMGNQFAQDLFIDQIATLRQKRHMAEAVCSTAVLTKNFIAMYGKTKPSQQFQYLQQYVEFRYQQIVGSLHRLMHGFYTQKKIESVRTVQASIANLTQMDHVKVVYLKPNNYSVRDCVVSPSLQCLESGSFIFGSNPEEDYTNFFRCVQPLVNQRALEPPQLTLFESLYQQDHWHRSQTRGFAGATSNTYTPFKALSTALIGLPFADRHESQAFITAARFQANDFMETVYDDTSLKSLVREDVYNLAQLVLAKKFVLECVQALLLRNALICWVENSTLPSTYKMFEEYEHNFRQNFFWKTLQQKEEIQKKVSITSQFGQIPSQASLQEMKQKIDVLVSDQNISTTEDLSKRDLLVRALKEEYTSLKKKVNLDFYFNVKAEIIVYSNEIEKLIIKASVKTLDSEASALAKCFTTQVPSVQYHIHPFQQFAATFYDKVDPNLNLDVSNKVNAIQEMLTKMRNRSTEVETLTSGPGMVLTIKDINEIMLEFCRTTIGENQKQFKSRGEINSVLEGNFRQLLYVKDQKIKTLEHRIGNISTNLDNMINSRLFERGNQLIYELDSSNRILNIFKATMFQLEQKLTEKILGEQLNKFKRKNNQVEMKNQKFDDYKQHIVNMIEQDFAQEQDRMLTILKDKAEAAKITDQKHSQYKRTPMYPATGSNTYLQLINNTKGGSKTQQYEVGKHPQNSGSIPGAIIPQNFRHYPHCFCYVPNPKHPWPTMELAELDMLSEQEARNELSRMCILIRKQRLLYRTKEMCMMTKYQNKINVLESQQNSNTLLWDQLAESEKRERVLRQELLFTQQSLSAGQKQIEILQGDIKLLNGDKNRLQKFKSSKTEELKELKDQVRVNNVFDNVDNEKLVRMLTKKDNQVRQMQSQAEVYDHNMGLAYHRRDVDVGKYKKLFVKEQAKTQSIIDKMDQLKLELKMLEVNDNSVTSIWKKKCLDLFEISSSVKKENEELRNRCFELINQGLTLAEQISLSNQSGQQQKIQVLPEIKSMKKLGGDLLNRGGASSVTLGGGVTQAYGIGSPPALRKQTETERLLQEQGLHIVYNPSHLPIGSIDTNVPIDGVLHSATTIGIKSPNGDKLRNKSQLNYTQNQNTKSFAQLKPLNQQALSPSPYVRSSDLKSILNQVEQDPSSIAHIQLHQKRLLQSEQKLLQSAKKQQSALLRRQVSSVIRTDEQPYSQMATGQSSAHMGAGFYQQQTLETSPGMRQMINESPAVKQLKSVNRFSRPVQPSPTFDLKGLGYSMGHLSPKATTEDSSDQNQITIQGRKSQQMLSDQKQGVFSQSQIKTTKLDLLVNVEQQQMTTTQEGLLSEAGLTQNVSMYPMKATLL